MALRVRAMKMGAVAFAAIAVVTILMPICSTPGKPRAPARRRRDELTWSAERVRTERPRSRRNGPATTCPVLQSLYWSYAVVSTQHTDTPSRSCSGKRALDWRRSGRWTSVSAPSSPDRNRGGRIYLAVACPRFLWLLIWAAGRILPAHQTCELIVSLIVNGDSQNVSSAVAEDGGELPEDVIACAPGRVPTPSDQLATAGARGDHGRCSARIGWLHPQPC